MNFSSGLLMVVATMVALLIVSAHGRFHEAANKEDIDAENKAASDRALLFQQWEDDNSCRGPSNCNTGLGVAGNKMHGSKLGSDCMEKCVVSDLRQIWLKAIWDFECGPCPA
jgi:hypothetical protein